MEVEERTTKSRGGSSRLALALVLLLTLTLAILIGSQAGKTRAALHPPADPALRGAEATQSASLDEKSQVREAVPSEFEEPRPSERSDDGRFVADAVEGAALQDPSKWSDARSGSRAVLGVVSGRVVDAGGEPCKAHVSLVSSNGGSIGLGTAQDGTFEFSSAEMFGHSSMTGEIALQATTEDGRVAVLGALEGRAAEDAADVVLTLEPGAKLSLSLDGIYDSLRCRLLHDGVIFEDFTLRKNQAASEVVPAGPLLVQLYSGGGEDMFLRDERALDLRAGEEAQAAFLVER